MGVDADIFAIKADKACDIDRLDNIKRVAWCLKDPKELETLIDKGSYGGKLTADELKRIALICKEQYQINPELKGYKDREYWMDCILAFVKKHPDDTFMIVNDHEDRWHDMWELKKREELLDWKTWKK